jgi:hypothetical protein
VWLAFFLFLKACSPESQMNFRSLSLKVQSKNPLASLPNQLNLSFSQSFSPHLLFEFLSPFWKNNTSSEFGIRSYTRPAESFGGSAYYGGVYDPINNQIVFIPMGQANEAQWHVYDCKTQRILAYPKPSGHFNYDYAGGVFDPTNNQIVFVPRNQAMAAQWHVYACTHKLFYPIPNQLAPLSIMRTLKGFTTV